MSNKKARTLEILARHANGHRAPIEIGPATLQVFAQVLTQTDVSKAQILTLIEAHNQLGQGNYRLVVTGARLMPADDPV